MFDETCTKIEKYISSVVGNFHACAANLSNARFILYIRRDSPLMAAPCATPMRSLRIANL